MNDQERDDWQHVRYWHLADIGWCTAHVCFLTQSGHFACWAESSKEEPLIIPAPEGYVNAIGYEPALCLKSRLLSANPVTVSQTT